MRPTRLLGAIVALAQVAAADASFASPKTVIGPAIRGDVVPLFARASDVAEDAPSPATASTADLSGVEILRETDDGYLIHVKGRDYWVNRADVRTSDEKQRRCETEGRIQVGASRGLGECP